MSVGASWQHAPADYPVCGAHKALTEGHVQLDILNSEVLPQVLGEYRALVLADQRILSEAEAEAIRSFVRQGGVLLATGETGTRDADNQPLHTFALAEVLGIEYGEVQQGLGYLRAPSSLSPYGIPAMDIPVGRTSLAIQTTTARVLLPLVPSYPGMAAPAPTPRGPGVTINQYGQGQAIYCALPLFHTYFAEGTPVLRKLALWMLDQVFPVESRTVLLEGAPVHVEMFYNRRDHECFLHLINYAGDKRETGTPQVQDLPTIHGIRVQLRVESPPVAVTSVPDGKNISFTYQGQRVSFDAEPLAIHSVYRIELQS